MKRIVSISVGSSARDHTTRHTFLGQECEISRRGTNGDFQKAIELYKELDGKVDAFGAGGVEFFLQVEDKRYYFRDVKRIRDSIKISKVGDGNGVKGLLEKRAFDYLEKYLNEKEGRSLKGLPALKTTVVERYSMGKAMVDAGLDVTFGDFMFALGLPIAMRSLSAARVVASVLLPVVTQVPFSWLYPLGSEQDKPPQNKWRKYYQRSQVIAGDFLQIRQYMPDDLTGKIIVTNTTTEKNVEELRKRNLHILVTVTPRLEGRSFGTNVMEATLLALMDKPQSEITQADFVDLINRIPLKPNIEVLN
ncbi:MAG: quinate 5-dehydrogenase [Anaerolineales bacterium]|nr:quinate 5-dehydrogenase [Anaerolineales bacterium]